MAGEDIILCDILSTHMNLAAERVFVYNQNAALPKDENLFIVVETGPRQIVSSVNNFDSDTNEEVQTATFYTTYNINIISKNTDAKTRAHEALIAIDSTYSVQQQELNNISIFRTGQMLDISQVEAASSLHRYQFPVIISHMETKRTAITPIDKFESTVTEVEENG